MGVDARGNRQLRRAFHRPRRHLLGDRRTRRGAERETWEGDDWRAGSVAGGDEGSARRARAIAVMLVPYGSLLFVTGIKTIQGFVRTVVDPWCNFVRRRTFWRQRLRAR